MVIENLKSNYPEIYDVNIQKESYKSLFTKFINYQRELIDDICQLALSEMDLKSKINRSQINRGQTSIIGEHFDIKSISLADLESRSDIQCETNSYSTFSRASQSESKVSAAQNQTNIYEINQI